MFIIYLFDQLNFKVDFFICTNKSCISFFYFFSRTTQLYNIVTCMHISACTYMLSVYDFPYKYVLHVEKKFSLVFIFSLFVYLSNKVIHYYTLFLRLFISHTFRVKSHKEVIPYYRLFIENNEAFKSSLFI